MKANVPEKLYIISDEEGVILSLDNATDSQGDRYDFVDEAVFPFEDGTFEYTRTDAFIEKACEWLKENGGSYWMDDYDLPTDDLVNDFKKYMGGE